MKKFTIITKDGSKWLRPVNPFDENGQAWRGFKSSNPDIPYIGSRPEGTTVDESEVKEVVQYRQKDNENADWKIWTTGVIDWDCVIETRTVYTDAESHDPDISDDYWRKRCEAAERYINESPCDPDITNTQEAAYDAWQEIVKQQPK